MPQETEVKLKVEVAEAARERLSALGARMIHPRHFEDNVLWDDAGHSIVASGRLLRLRTTPSGAILTYKGPRTVKEGMKSREELETPVAEPDRFREILEGLGYRPIFRYQKYREAYALGGTEVVLDETPIGTFLEVEGEPAEIRTVAHSLGYSEGEFISESYAALFVASGGWGDMVFP